MTVRRARQKDYVALMALYTDFVGKDYSKLNSDSFLAVLAGKNNFVFVAEDNSKLIGLITASKRRVVRYLQPIMQVDELYVDLGFRKHGVGRALIQRVEELARQQDCHRIYIESRYKHESGHKFYNDNGYENHGYYFLKLI